MSRVIVIMGEKNRKGKVYIYQKEYPSIEAAREEVDWFNTYGKEDCLNIAQMKILDYFEIKGVDKSKDR